jgi:hypothetical protein
MIVCNVNRFPGVVVGADNIVWLWILSPDASILLYGWFYFGFPNMTGR